MIIARLIGDSIASNSREAFSLYEKSRFGERRRDKIEYSSLEALFLLFENKIEIFSNNKKITEDQLVKRLKKHDKKLMIKFPVFLDLRKKGYIVKTALKFGAEFRVYEKGIKPGQDHAKWIVFPVKETESHSWHDLAAKNRVSHAAKKKLLIAIVDEESDVTYFEVDWIRP